MAHYVAELIELTRTAPPETRNAAEERCSAAILDLWKHRADLSHRPVPMDLNRIKEVLQRLDPAAPQPIYFLGSWRDMSREAVDGHMGETTKPWFRIAEQVDHAARIMIVAALGKAAETETDRAKHWVKLAEAAGLDGGPDVQLIRRLIVLIGHGGPDSAAEIEELRDRLIRLNELRRAADIIELEWQARLLRLETETSAVSSAGSRESS